MNGLRDMLNEFYHNIPEWLLQPIISAINSAEEADEDHIITPLSQLIINLDRGLNTVAVNNYMTNPVTRGSVTRRFFFPHTLRGNLYPEDREIYAPPPPPAGEGLVLAPPAIPQPPRIDSFFQPGVEAAIAEMARQEPNPYQAQAPGVVPRNIRTLPNDLEEGEIQE